MTLKSLLRQRLGTSGILLATVIFAASYFSFAAPSQKDSPQKNTLQKSSPKVSANLSEPIPVLDVVDGDTIRVLWNGDRRLVRFVGIDAPESRQNPRTSRQATRHETTEAQVLELGARATKQLKTLIGKSTKVQLEFDVERQDHYGRLLAYVYCDNILLNREMLRTGYAQLYTFPPNTKYTEEFREVFKTARLSNRGLWSFEGFGDPEKSSSQPLLRGRTESERHLGSHRNSTTHP